jgi:hypothetical protein
MISSIGQTNIVSNVEKVTSIDLTTFSEAGRGNLTVVEAGRNIPIPIVRIFYIYGIPKHCDRGAHAHKMTAQVFIAINGTFSLELRDPKQARTFTLANPHRAIYVPPMIWARLHCFSDDAVGLVLADTPYDPADYIRDWDDYVAAVSSTTGSIRKS